MNSPKEGRNFSPSLFFYWPWHSKSLMFHFMQFEIDTEENIFAVGLASNFLQKLSGINTCKITSTKCCGRAFLDRVFLVGCVLGRVIN